MTEHPHPEQLPSGDPASEPEAGLATPREMRPSEEVTADIEERQDPQRAKEREAGRPPSDAPA